MYWHSTGIAFCRITDTDGTTSSWCSLSKQTRKNVTTVFVYKLNYAKLGAGGTVVDVGCSEGNRLQQAIDKYLHWGKLKCKKLCHVRQPDTHTRITISWWKLRPGENQFVDIRTSQAKVLKWFSHEEVLSILQSNATFSSDPLTDECTFSIEINCGLKMMPKKKTSTRLSLCIEKLSAARKRVCQQAAATLMDHRATQSSAPRWNLISSSKLQGGQLPGSAV